MNSTQRRAAGWNFVLAAYVVSCIFNTHDISHCYFVRVEKEWKLNYCIENAHTLFIYRKRICIEIGKRNLLNSNVPNFEDYVHDRSMTCFIAALNKNKVAVAGKVCN